MNKPAAKARAPRKPRAPKGLMTLGGGDIREESISTYTQDKMTEYAEETNLNRSVPDLIDGLKPVQRRVLWAASQMTGQGFRKTARIVGDVIGKYHPHGDGSVASAIEIMVQHPTPTLLGAGNWGGLLDGAAAMRYTNCRLSAYGETFFDSDYINRTVSSFVPNYDGEDIEPVSLPAMLPNVLLNGGEGIGVGTTTAIPTFTPESLVGVLKRMLGGEKLAPKDFANDLVFNSRWGGHVLRTKQNMQNYLGLFTHSSASIQFRAKLVIKRDEKAIEINDWPPGLNPTSLVASIRGKVSKKTGKITGGLAEVDRVYNHESDTGFRIEMRKDHNYTQFDALVKKIERLTTSRKSYRINVTYRSAKTEDGKTTFDTRFLTVSVPKLLGLWLRERLQLEKRSLEYRLAKQEAAIAHTKLLIFAASKLDVIFKALKLPDSRKYLVSALKITPEQADVILDLKVRQLSKLDKDTMTKKLKEQEGWDKQLKAWYKKPREKVALDFDLALKAIEKDRKYEGVKEETLQVA